jgi:plasmid stabilization system protein ParE
MRVRLLDQAKEDLVEIRQYYQKIGGVLLAKKMVLQIRTPVLALERNPEVAPSYEISPGIRRLVVVDGAFLVFYQLGNVDVEVLHIRRAEREPVTASELGR